MNLTSITLRVTGANAQASVAGPLTSGMVGIPVTIQYDDSWEGLTKNLVCRCSRGADSAEHRTILNVGSTAVVAHEVMKAGMLLYLGVEGHNADGTLVIPTIWAMCGVIQTGANTSEDLSADPTLPVWGQLQTEIERIRQDAVTPEQLTGIQSDIQSAVQASAIYADRAEAAAKRAEDTAQAELAGDDIPKVFFVGTTPTTKAEDELPLTMEYISKSERFFSYVTLKVQGDSSAGYPVKNFNLKMFSDEGRSEKLKMQFRNWTAKTHKYCLKKNWIDVLHIRNVVNGRLWGQVARSRADYDSYPAEYRESSNCGAVDGFPVKVYVNGVYQGLYTWNIRKDDSMFNMDDSTGTHAALIADSAADSVLWRALPGIDGTDWTDELNDTPPQAVLTGFRDAANFVMTASDADFKANIGQYFYKSSLIDFYAFIYAIQMVGGLGKSQTMLTYDGQRFLANIYDMDTTWALMWHGNDFYPTNMTCPEGYLSISGGKSNLLYERLVAAFPDEIRERYFELRRGPLSTANVINEVERFSDPIVAAGLYAEEVAGTTPYGPSRPSRDTNTIQKLRQIITDRLAFVDGQMAQLRSPVAATSVSLSAAALVFEDKETQTLTATVEPADTTDTVEWTSSDNAVATVEGGVVTPVSNGSCTITATAGNVSAVCAVTVRYAEKYCTGVTLSASTLAFTGKAPQTLTATVEPADTTDVLTWESSDETIATVVDGVVTPKWNGNAVITAVCGSQRAECMVTVSGIEASPLDGVAMHNGYCYVGGELTAKAKYFATGKFRLEDGPCTITTAHGNAVHIHMWDESGVYIGAVKHGNASADGTASTRFIMLAKSGYTYAMDWTYTLTETDTIDNVTVTKRTVSKPDAQQSWNMAALAFTDESGGGFNGTASAILTDATFSHDLTDVASANHVVFSDVMGQVLYSGFAPGSNIFVINWRNSGGYKPKVYFKGTAADIAAYFAEHETVLTFN